MDVTRDPENEDVGITSDGELVEAEYVDLIDNTGRIVGKALADWRLADEAEGNPDL